jgi:hypothetical protein
MITSLKLNFIHFLDEVISGKNGCLSHTRTGKKVVLTAFETFRSENFKKMEKIRNQHALRTLPVFSKLKSDA